MFLLTICQQKYNLVKLKKKNSLVQPVIISVLKGLSGRVVGREGTGYVNKTFLVLLYSLTLIWMGDTMLPQCWFSYNNSKTVKYVTLASCRIQ